MWCLTDVCVRCAGLDKEEDGQRGQAGEVSLRPCSPFSACRCVATWCRPLRVADTHHYRSFWRAWFAKVATATIPPEPDCPPPPCRIIYVPDPPAAAAAGPKSSRKRALSVATAGPGPDTPRRVIWGPPPFRCARAQLPPSTPAHTVSAGCSRHGSTDPSRLAALATSAWPASGWLPAKRPRPGRPPARSRGSSAGRPPRPTPPRLMPRRPPPSRLRGRCAGRLGQCPQLRATDHLFHHLQCV